MRGFAKFLVVILIIVFMIAIGGAAAVYYENWENDLSQSDSKFAQFLSKGLTEKTEEKELEPNFTCLVMGRNQHLTDFMMLCQYNPNTGEASLMSIPRDTYVDKASSDGKINSIYSYKYQDKVVKTVSDLTGVEINHYLIFDAKILKKVVDAIGGVTVYVPINMNYDDPVQNLYIHLNKGTQKLTGNQAEQFVRFRKNNDGSGYANGDIGRIAAQQSFIKAFIQQMLKPENLAKVMDIAKIVIDGTKTDMTIDVIEEYIDELVVFKMDKMRVETLPGIGKYMKGPDGLVRSFFVHDEEKTKEVVQKLFFMTEEEAANATISGNALLNDSSNDKDTNNKEPNNNYYDVNDDNNEQEVISPSLETEDEEIKVEVLSAKAKTSRFNELVSSLNNGGCNVVKIGNYQTTQVESSRIIVYGKYNEKDLELVKELSGIKKIEQSTDDTNVTFTIVIGANY